MVLKNLLEIDNLKIRFMSDQETVNAVNDISIIIKSGEVLGIVGESGAGKSTMGKAAMGYTQPGCKIIKGEINFNGIDLTN